ncbi:MAG: hypothetical protein ABS84_01855 [Rubrivivax sp. SCN 71-131]|nr:MAG: hypothetical protein ABS84_01855 [Rubrivivax sp. SCN 71-131]
MKKVFDPRRLDVRALARAGGELAGQWPLAGFERLCASLRAGDDGAVPGQVTWSARGAEVPVRGGASQTWLHLQARAPLPLACQRCLGPMIEQAQIARSYQFVADEAAAQALDGEVEHEVLVLERELDLHALAEDELLLDLPLVPRHAACPQPLPGADDAAAAAAVPESPFAALAALRNKTR